MLSRLGSLLQSKSTASDEEVENAVTNIKALGRRSAGSTDESSLEDIEQILSLMRTHSDSLAVQRVACHALSNLAMQVMSARWIVQKNGFTLIYKAIERFLEDHKLCWLASSAIWNLARPPANRTLIGRQGANAMLYILREHQNKEKVTNTAIGALSNLSLLDGLKDMIAQDDNLRLVLSVLKNSLKRRHLSVMTSGSGLLANIAVSDLHAAKLIESGALEIILPLLQWYQQHTESEEAENEEDETLFRNTCAALNNLVTAEGFLPAFLKCKGLETVLHFLKTYENEMYGGLLENCLASIDADRGVSTSSLAYACFHGQLEVFQYLYALEPHAYDLNECDGRNMTCLDYALSSEHADIVLLLSKLGATAHSRNELSDEMTEALNKGQSALQQSTSQHVKALEDALIFMPTDICKHLVGYQLKMDIVQSSERL